MRHIITTIRRLDVAGPVLVAAVLFYLLMSGFGISDATALIVVPVMFFVIGGLLTFGGWRCAVAPRWDDLHPGVCRACRYDLRGLPDDAVKCPECGGVINHDSPQPPDAPRAWPDSATMFLAGVLVFFGLVCIPLAFIARQLIKFASV